MGEVEKCLSVFAVAIVANNVRSIEMIDAAVDAHVEPHERTGAARPALETLLQAFGDLRQDSAVAYAIRTDPEGRLVQLAELVDS